jgi:hypothetical protein
MELVRQTEGIPFEPDWLMQALSVAPLPDSGVEFETAPTNDEARLVIQLFSVHGRPLRRVIVVDLKRGGIVTEHSLYDYNGRPIATAKLGRHTFHAIDKKSKIGVVMPHRVVLDWPQNQMSVTMELGKIEINPNSFPSEVWAMPRLPKSEIVNLDENVHHRRIATRPGSAVRLDTIDDDVTDTDEMPSEEDALPDDSNEPTSEDAEMAGHSSVISESEEEEYVEEEPQPANNKPGKIQFTAEDE